jgi:DNA replication protein DnaC
MNKPILMPELTATRARTGMNRVGDLIELLIKQYELKEELRNRQQRAREAQAKSASNPNSQTAEFMNSRTQQGKSTPVQATFAWFDSTSADAASI